VPVSVTQLAPSSLPPPPNNLRIVP
jgi:hypothetical protein